MNIGAKRLLVWLKGEGRYLRQFDARTVYAYQGRSKVDLRNKRAPFAQLMTLGYLERMHAPLEIAAKWELSPKGRSASATMRPRTPRKPPLFTAAQLAENLRRTLEGLQEGNG